MNIKHKMTKIKEAAKPFSAGLKVMSLQDFVKGTEENIPEEKLSGVTAQKFDKADLIAYLDRIIAKEKEKSEKYKRPYIHGGNIPIVNTNGEKYDLDALRKLITQRPAKILKQNEKMQHSDGTSSVFFNIGLPALKGLAVDEDNKEFVIIDTCPGAGACKTYCYAMKGGYVQWKASSLSQTRLLNFLYNDPAGFMAQLSTEINDLKSKLGKKNTKMIIRWHDAGDFFSPQYLNMAYDVARNFDNVDFYAYTKLAKVAQSDKPKNFKMNFSMGAAPKQEKQIDYAVTKNSRVVPKELFSDLLVKDESGKWQYKSTLAKNQLKQKIATKYNLNPKSVITYDEMMKIKPGSEAGKYNVIVKPGDGDDAANRSDVLGSYLLIH